MTVGSTLRRPIHCALVGAVIALAVVGVPATAGQSAAHAQRAAASAMPRTYHLTALFQQGPMAGNTVDGQMSGQVGSSGPVTAVLTTTLGTTATVTGNLSSAGVHLTVRGQAGTFALNGHGAGRGNYGGTISQAGVNDAGAWLLIPETTASAYTFEGRITNGPHHGHIFSATLALASQVSGRFDGALTLDDGTVLPAEGRLAFGNMQLAVRVPGEGLLLGTATRSQIQVIGIAHEKYEGDFVGPGSGDRGTWAAISQ